MKYAAKLEFDEKGEMVFIGPAWRVVISEETDGEQVATYLTETLEDVEAEEIDGLIASSAVSILAPELPNDGGLDFDAVDDVAAKALEEVLRPSVEALFPHLFPHLFPDRVTV